MYAVLISTQASTDLSEQPPRLAPSSAVKPPAKLQKSQLLKSTSQPMSASYPATLYTGLASTPKANRSF